MRMPTKDEWDWFVEKLIEEDYIGAQYGDPEVIFEDVLSELKLLEQYEEKFGDRDRVTL